jgi:uncharacterized spore protein YtfJ
MATEMRDQPQLVEELLQRIGNTVGDKARVSTVFGDPVEQEGITVIPVAKARFGFGGGGGGGGPKGEEGSGGGGGGGAAVTPVGYIEVRPGSAAFRRIPNASDVVAVVAASALAALTLKRLLGD